MTGSWSFRGVCGDHVTLLYLWGPFPSASPGHHPVDAPRIDPFTRQAVHDSPSRTVFDGGVVDGVVLQRVIVVGLGYREQLPGRLVVRLGLAKEECRGPHFGLSELSGDFGERDARVGLP